MRLEPASEGIISLLLSMLTLVADVVRSLQGTFKLVLMVKLYEDVLNLARVR